MAYVEVWKSGRLLTRRRVAEDKTRKGCRVRLGSAGEVRVAIGESETLGQFEVRMEGGSMEVAVTPAMEITLTGPVQEVATGGLTTGFIEFLASLCSPSPF